MNLVDNDLVTRLIELAKREDMGAGDVTSQLMEDSRASTTFHLLAKESCVFAGCEIAASILQAYDDSLQIEWQNSTSRHSIDGQRIEPGSTPLAMLHGPLLSLLSCERVLLNFLQRLCGIATQTQRYVEAIAGTQATIYDTRKTTPGWRLLEKYAVRCGGGSNHRVGLHDAVLIKDNHLVGVSAPRMAGTIFDMLNRLPAKGQPPSFVEVEADTLEQLEELLKVVGIDIILLDNFTLADLKKGVDMRNRLGLADRVSLEASGGITLDTVKAVAKTGVERISVGAITHSVRSIDLSLERV